MKLIKSSTALLGVLLITGCSALEQWKEEIGFASESVNHYSSAKIPNTKAKNKVETFTENRASTPVYKPNNVVVNKRINTTACLDSDDWYLDGYRVGKSFRGQKNQMLQQRSQYCGYSVKGLPTEYLHNWERGFRIGTKS